MTFQDSGLEREDSPGPDVQARLEGGALRGGRGCIGEGGTRSHPGIVSSGWGLNTLRLLWDISRGWTLHHGCSRRQSSRCLGTLSWRVVCGSPGSARAISGRGTGQNPGPESMPSAGVNHGGRLACAARARSVCGRGGSGVRQRRLRYQNEWVAMRMEEPFLMVPVSN